MWNQPYCPSRSNELNFFDMQCMDMPVSPLAHAWHMHVCNTQMLVPVCMLQGRGEASSLQQRWDELKKQLQTHEKAVARYGELRREQVNQTKEIRDWHIKRFWRWGPWGWKEEMQVYEDQVQGDRKRMASDEQDLVQKCTELKDDQAQIQKEIEAQKTHLARLRMMDSPKSWENVLQAENLPALEAEVNEKEGKRQLIVDQLRQAVTDTGVVDPEQAAQIITQHETSKILLSETTAKSKEVSARIRELVSQMELLVLPSHNDSQVSMQWDREDLEALATGVEILQEMHEEDVHRLVGKRDETFRNVVASVAAFQLQGQQSLTDGKVQVEGE